MTAVDPALNDDIVGARPTITVTFSEATDPASWTQLGLVVQTPEGALVPGTLSVTAPNAGSFRPSDDLVAGGVYVLTVGAVTDSAGKQVAPSGSWVAVDRPVPLVTLKAAPSLVDRGATTLLTGRLMARPRLRRWTRRRAGPATWRLWHSGAVPVAAYGSFATRVTPSSTTQYSLSVPAADGFGAGSVSATVSVRRAVRLNWSASVVRSGRVCSRVSFVASVSPVAGGVGVTFRLEHWSPVSRSWRLVGTPIWHTDATGRPSVTWLPSGSGLYRWRVVAASTLDYSTGSSAWVRWSIGR